MSFILDALKKSENERQQQGQPEFAGVPSTSQRNSTPRWLWIVGALLAINIAVLAGVLMRPEVAATSRSIPASQPIVPPVAPDEPSFSDRVAAAQRELPQQTLTAPVAETAPQRVEVQPVVVTQTPEILDTRNVYPTMQEVAAGGQVALPVLHLDIHVFSDTPEDRFIFVNMSQYREGARLQEGPELLEITPEGAVLRHRGVTFLLPRE